jgi:predicted peptidase
MKRSLFFIGFAFISLYVFSQRPVATIEKFSDGENPVIDGQPDVLWETTEAFGCNENFVGEYPSFINNPVWKAGWTDDALYIIIEIADDEWAPSWITGNADWLSDKVELYFDVNTVLHNGEGASVNDNGHYQVAPNFSETNAGQLLTGYFGQGYRYEYANTYNGEGNSVFEYKIPFSSLIDDGGNPLNPVERTTIGFDVVVLDNDPLNSGRHRIVWSNNGAVDYDGDGNTSESWFNMDDVGELVFHAEEPPADVEIIAFQLDGIEGNINNNEIIVPFPKGTDLSSLTATFEISEGAVLEVNGTAQQSGVTINDYSTPLNYVLKIEEAEVATYEVYIHFYVTEHLAEVAPLIQDNWSSHTWPYNAYYPETDDPDHRHGVVNGRVASSCGPTSVSRLIHYWEYPVAGNGSVTFTDRYGCTYSANFGATTYRWNEMPNELHVNDDESVYDPVAELVYHVGTSALDEQVTGYFDLAYSLPEYFLYADSIRKLYREDFTRNEWITLFKHELSNGRPMIVSGGTPEGGGHWFICDGYNADDEFHFIMGWGGRGDGYYDIDNPNGYSEGADIVIGVMPRGHEFVPDFVADKSETEPGMVTFENTTWQLTNEVLSWHWDFGDGTTSSEKNPVHQYNDSGYFTVRLTVNSRERTKTVSHQVNFISRPVANIYRVPEGMEINLDGEIDDFWNEVAAHSVNKPFLNESPSFISNPLWKAAWDDEAIYVIIEINDDEWAPSWITGLQDWQSDKPELYFDVNEELHNGEGAGSGVFGHFEVSANYSQWHEGETMSFNLFGRPVEYANKYNEEGYSVFEYKILFESLWDVDSQPLNPFERNTVGFDVNINDNTPSNAGRSRIVWANDGIADYGEDGNTGENTNIMDDAGEINFVQEEVVIPPKILSFSINGVEGSIDGNTIQIDLGAVDDLTGLIADFTTSEGAVVKVDGVFQENGATPNNFTNPVVYVVEYEEGITSEYTVEVVASNWIDGYPRALGGFTSARLKVALNTTGTVYYLISASSREYSATEISQLATSENLGSNIAAGTFSIASPSEIHDRLLEGLFDQNMTYYAYFAAQTGSGESQAFSNVNEKVFETHAFETVVPRGTSDAAHGFLQYIPENYYLYPEEKLPLLIFYHGLGEISDGSFEELMYRLKPAVPEGIFNIPYEHLLFIPQCHTTWWESANMQQTFTCIEENFVYDPKRVYLTGLSMGGDGTTISIDTFGDKVAAAVTTASAGIIRIPVPGIKVWALHNKDDNMVPVENSYRIADSVLYTGGNPVLTIYPEYGHDSWSESYNNPKVWDWLFAQGRGEPYKLASVITAKEIGENPEIDGELNETEWDMPYTIEHDGNVKAYFDLLWNEDEKLYIAVQVNDDNLVNGTDGVNVYIDADYSADGFDSSDRKYAFTLNSNQVDGLNNSADNSKHQWSETSTGYLLEAQFDLTDFASHDMTEGLTRGYTLGFDLEIVDETGNSVFWCGDAGNTTSTENYGTLSLMGHDKAGISFFDPVAEFAHNAPIIDGEKGAAWNNDNLLDLDWAFTGMPDDNFFGNVHLMWDTTNLYVYAGIGDAVAVTTAPGGIEANDHVNILIDMDMGVNSFDETTCFFDENDYHFQVKRTGNEIAVLDYPGRNSTEIASRVECATKERSNGWVVEVRFPFEQLLPGYVARDGNKIRFDFVVGDSDDPADDRVDYRARLGSSLRRSPEFKLGYSGKYFADPFSWVDVAFDYDEKEVSAPTPMQVSSCYFYPNPAKNRLYINNNEADNAVVEIASPMGNVRLRKTLRSGEKEIDISAIEQGLYIIRLTNERNVFSQSFIIAR